MRFRAFSPHGFSAGQCLSKSGCQLSSGFVCVVFKVSLTLKNYNFWLLENICVFIYLNKIYFKAVYLYHVMYPDVTMFSSTYCSTIVWSTSVLLVPFSYANTACTSLYTHTHKHTKMVQIYFTPWLYWQNMSNVYFHSGTLVSKHKGLHLLHRPQC